MDSKCHECGAPLAAETPCINHFHALLVLEQEVAADPSVTAGGRGEIAHFYAVSSYVLQHPEGMNYTAGALHDLRQNVGDILADRVTLPELRKRIRRATDGPTRITRRPGDPVVRWAVTEWPVTVADILNGGVEGYVERVAAWARSVIETLPPGGTRER